MECLHLKTRSQKQKRRENLASLLYILFIIKRAVFNETDRTQTIQVGTLLRLFRRKIRDLVQIIERPMKITHLVECDRSEV